MSRIKDQLVARLRATLGDTPDVAAVVDELYRKAVIDDALAKRGVVVHEFYERCAKSTQSTQSIMLDLCYEYDVASRSNINYMVAKAPKG